MSSVSDNGKKFISIDEIRNLYNKSSRQRNQPDLKSQAPVDLTASAKFIVREAKKIFGTIAERNDDFIIPTEDEISEVIKSVESKEGEELSVRERHAAIAALATSLDHYDILGGLIENPEVNDIIVRSYRDISIQIGRKNIQTDLSFSDFDTYKSFVERLLKRAGKSCTVANPIVDASIDPHIRASVTHESLSPGDAGPMLTLRISRHSSISLESLITSEFAPEPILSYLSNIVSSGVGAVMIGGEVGTGKTTLVRALASSINESDAILVIEDTNEINLKRRFVRTLLTREGNIEGFGLITPAQAIRAGMRMAMNRIILGEIRDGQAAEAFIDVCASGHSGMSTIHAKSNRDIVSRLELFLSRAQGEVGIDTIRRQIANAISVVIYIGLDSVTKRRRILDVSEIHSASDGVVQLSPIFSGKANAGKFYWVREGGVSKFQDYFNESNYQLPMPGTEL